MRVNMNKTKVMIRSGERQKVRQKAVRWPCGVCSKSVGSNSLQCTSCHLQYTVYETGSQVGNLRSRPGEKHS